MSNVYTEYFQKSKVFLYPLLDLGRGIKYVPKETYCAWEDVYSTDDMMFLCVYKCKLTLDFKKFANRHLIAHPLFRDHISLATNRQLFVFNFDKYSHDYKNFLKGKYSQYSINGKISILEFFETAEEEQVQYIQGFLQPDEVHEAYAIDLNVDIELLEDVYEVCSAPNMEKEILIDNNHILTQLLKESSIYLTNK